MSGEANNLLPGSVPEHPTKQDGTPILDAPPPYPKQDGTPILVAPPPYQENQQCKFVKYLII